jgi:enoyl-CoA hydratase/carnithine racemase
MTEVLVEKRNSVQWITINREERRNAMNDAVVFGIMDGLTAATSDPEIRAVVLTGAGDRAFCAGADLSAGAGSFKYDYSKVGIPFVQLMKQARDLTVPLIARVNGHAMAGGMGMMGMCDMAIAVENARFGMPEVKVGVFPMQIMAVLQRLIPNRKLYEMALTGSRLRPQRRSIWVWSIMSCPRRNLMRSWSGCWRACWIKAPRRSGAASMPCVKRKV